jgi:large subunit ribosomal protein L3
MRTGLIATKVGMSSFFEQSGVCTPVTLLQIEDCSIVDLRTKEKNGYNSVVVGSGEKKSSRCSKAMIGVFSKLNVAPKKILKEFRVDTLDGVELGTKLSADHFNSGAYIDVSGVTIGKGFAGGMKRHNFRGLEASHGVSVSHRSHGSTGGRQDPGRVFKNKKMAGHMGARSCTKQNLKIASIDSENNIIIVVGSVPGSRGSRVFITDAVKKTA